MDFFGDTTPASVLEAISSMTQITGADVWPFIAFVGVPLAFMIGGFVVALILGSVDGRRRTSGGGYETDQYTAEQSARIVAKIREIERRPGAGYP